MNYELSLDKMEDFCTWFWNKVGENLVFAFHGPMGAGKTTIIEALCRYKGVEDSMGSPTFSIINEYGYREGGWDKKIFHIDLYRLKGEEEIIASGVEECVYSGEYCFVEWPDLAPWLFKEAVHIYISLLSEGRREVKMQFS